MGPERFEEASFNGAMPQVALCLERFVDSGSSDLLPPQSREVRFAVHKGA